MRTFFRTENENLKKVLSKYTDIVLICKTTFYFRYDVVQYELKIEQLYCKWRYIQDINLRYRYN